MKNIIKKHPGISYFIITFGWTWSIVFWLLLSGRASELNNPTPVFIISAIISGLSPTIAAFTITGITKGKTGIVELISRLKIKNSPRWYVMALFLVPAVTILTTMISNLYIRPYQLNIVVPTIIMGLVWPLFSSLGEEFGWRGYILPKFLSGNSTLKSGLILGVIWATWHVPMDYFAYKDFGIYIIPAFLLLGYATLTLQALIMNYIFINTKGSLKLMVLYHYSITASAILLGGFFKTEALPKYTVCESLVSVVLFAIAAAVVYLKNYKAANKKREEVLC